MSGVVRPHGDRRRHQLQMVKKRRQQRKRRRARVRRLQFLRGLRTAKFWTKFSTYIVIFLLIAFWAKFAVVYDIPSYAQRGPLVAVERYVTVKPWWFGPPVFDLASYGSSPQQSFYADHPYQYLLHTLGRYQSIVTAPAFVWMQRQ